MKKGVDKPRGEQAPGEGQSFEKAMERLEKIVGEMEDGTLGLEDMIKRFEEGQTLIKFCSGRLNEVEKKVEVLVSKGGAINTEPFAADAEEESDSKGAGEGLST